MRAITGAELTRATGTRVAHLTLLVERRGRVPQPLPAADRRPLPHPRQRRSAAPGSRAVTLEQVEEHAEGLVCLSGCARDGAVAGAWERGEAGRGAALARRLLGAFGRDRFRVELQRPYWRHDRARNRWLAGLAERLGVPCVATGNVHSHARRRARLQDAFVAVRLGMTLEESEPQRRGNRASALASPQAMAARFAEHPEAVAETLRLAERLQLRPRPRSSATATRAKARTRRRPRAGRALPGAAGRALRAARTDRRKAGGAAGGGAGDDPRPRPLRLLPPPPRPARAGPRGRGARCAAAGRRAPSCRRGAAAAPASARSSAT